MVKVFGSTCWYRWGCTGVSNDEDKAEVREGKQDF